MGTELSVLVQTPNSSRDVTGTCPCCGAALPPEIPRLSRGRLAIYTFVRDHPACTIDDIVNHVYRDRIDGGPITANNSILVSIIKTNKRLAALGHGYRIKSSHRGPGATWSLMKVEPNAHQPVPSSLPRL